MSIGYQPGNRYKFENSLKVVNIELINSLEVQCIFDLFRPFVICNPYNPPTHHPPPPPTEKNLHKKQNMEKERERERERWLERQDQEKTVIIMITYLRKSKGTLTLMSLKTNIHSFIYQTYPGIFSCAAAVGFVVDIPYHKNYLVSRRG